MVKNNKEKISKKVKVSNGKYQLYHKNCSICPIVEASTHPHHKNSCVGSLNAASFSETLFSHQGFLEEFSCPVHDREVAEQVGVLVG